MKKKIQLEKFMRLHNYYLLCRKLRDAIDHLQFKEQAKRNGLTSYYIEGWNEYKSVLNELREIPILKDDIDSLYRSVPVFVAESDTPEINADTRSTLLMKKSLLLNKLDTIIDLGKSINPNNQTLGIDVRIPHCDDLQQYIGYLKDIDFILNRCPYLLEKDASIQFTGTDVGSCWVVFGIMGGVALGTVILKNLAELIDCAIRVKSHFISVKQQELILEQMECETEAKKTYSSIVSTISKQILAKEVETLSHQEKIDDPEKKDQVIKSLEKIVNLYNNGGGIFTSLEAPKEVQVLFPPIDSKNVLSDSALKLLESTNQNDDHDQ